MRQGNVKQRAFDALVPPPVQLWMIVLGLTAFGLVMIYSASAVMSLDKYGDASHYLKRQAVFAVLGLTAMGVLGRLPFRFYRVPVHLALLAGIIALMLVSLPGFGVEINGARRWFRLGPVFLQPAEFIKVIWILFLGLSLCLRSDRLADLRRGLLPYVAVLAVVGLLLLRQPDFGTALILSILTVAMLAVGGVPWLHLALLIPPGAFALYWFVYRVSYRWERVTSFIDPWTDPLGAGYHLIQGWIAVGSGGIFGSGLGAGEQKLFYLPEPYTDFILAVIGEELGFLGIAAVAAAFFLLLRAGLKISQSAPDQQGAMAALGLTLLLCTEALVNMGVVLGLFPTKGLPLPFLSYGGSSLAASCLAAGALLSIARESSKREG